MDQYDRDLLEEFGFDLECESPFEISIPGVTRSFASGHCAQLILNHLANLKESLTAQSDHKECVHLVGNLQEECSDVKDSIKDLKQELLDFEKRHGTS